MRGTWSLMKRTGLIAILASLLGACGEGAVAVGEEELAPEDSAAAESVDEGGRQPMSSCTGFMYNTPNCSYITRYFVNRGPSGGKYCYDERWVNWSQARYANGYGHKYLTTARLKGVCYWSAKPKLTDTCAYPHCS